MVGKNADKRKAPRAKVSFFLDCNVRLDQPSVPEAVIEDLSWGGIRLNFHKDAVTAGLKTGDRVMGEIESENPALQMVFTGKVMWVADFLTGGDGRRRVGISLDEEVVYSEVLHSLRPQEKAGEQK